MGLAADLNDSECGIEVGDPRRLRVHRAVTRRDVPYVPTDDAVVPAILRLAKVTAEDVVYDLGCGDGRIVIAAAKQRGARGLGVDIDPLRIQECHDNLRRAGARVKKLVQFVQGSLFDIDLRPATVMTLYLLPSLNIKLRSRILSDLRPGSRVISNHFDMADWMPDEVVEAHHRKLHLWIVPAWVAGEWHCTVYDPAGRRHVRLHLERRYQIVTGRAIVGGRDTMIGHGRIRGDQLTFRLVEWGRGGVAMRYEATVAGRQLRGRCWEEGKEGNSCEWGGARVDRGPSR